MEKQQSERTTKSETSEKSIDSEVSKLEKEIAIFSNRITTLERDSKSTIQEFDKTLDSVGKQIKESLSQTVRSIRFYFWTVFVFWILGGIGIGYALWFSPDVTVTFVVIWVIIGMIVLWNARDRRNNLQTSERILTANLPSDVAPDDGKANLSLSLPNEFSLAQSLSKTIQDALGKLTSAAILLTPKFSQIINLRTMKMKQEHFIDDFSFALSHYKLVLDYSEVQALLTRKFWIYDDDTLWLNDSIEEIKKSHLFENSVPILKLVYYDSTNQGKQVKQVWEELCADPKLGSEFATLLISKELLDTKSVNRSSVGPLSELFLEMKEEYTLGKVNTIATEFFDKLARYKADIVSDLGVYGLEIKDDLEQLMDFMPTASPNLWRDKVLDFTASLVKTDPTIVRLLVRETRGDHGRLDAWRNIIGLSESETKEAQLVNKHLIVQLARILGEKRISKPFVDFKDDTFLKHLELILSSFPDSFSPSKVEAELRLLETQILRVRRNIEATRSRYKLGYVELAFLDEFVPQTIHSVEKDLVSVASTQSDVNPKIFEVLYYSLVAPEFADRIFVEMKGASKENSQLNLIANFMIAKKLVPSTQFNQYLETLLQTQESFDLNQFVQLYFRYERLYRASDTLCSFLDEHRIRGTSPKPDLNRILELCPVDDKRTFENLLVTIAENLVTDQVETHPLSPAEMKDLASAATTLSLKSQNDISYKQLCVTIAGHRFAPRILYEFANVDKIDPNPTLANATVRALNTNLEGHRYFAGFVSQMELGILHLRIGNLLEVQISEATEKIKSWQETMPKTGEEAEFKESIRDLFNEQINEDIIKEFLTQQIVSAYIITDPNNNPLIRLLEDQESLKESQDHLKLVNLVQTRKGSGKGTRIGLVPFGMPFEDFSGKFDLVLQEAVRIHNQRHMDDHIPDPLPCYLLRIFPSEYGLREIMTESEKEARPVELVRELMEQSIGSINEIKLLSLVQSAKTGYEGFKSVIRAVVDHHRSSIMSLVGESIDSFLNTSSELKQWFQDKEVDMDLLNLYSTDKLSELCVKISKEASLNAGTSSEFFKSNLLKQMPKCENLSRSELEFVIDQVYSRLKNIGVGLVT